MARYHRLVVAVWIVVVVGSAILVPRFQSSVTGPHSMSSPPTPIARRRSWQRGSTSHSPSKISSSSNRKASSRPISHSRPSSVPRSTVWNSSPAWSASSRRSILAPRVWSRKRSCRHGGRRVERVQRGRQALAPRLTQEAASAATDEVRVYVTGRSPLIAELVAQQQDDLSRAERLGLPVALLILLITSGAVVAAGLPLVLAMSGVIVTFGTSARRRRSPSSTCSSRTSPP